MNGTSGHEPECDFSSDLRVVRHCTCDRLRAAYRRGYNDHAAAAQHWQDTHGAYRQHGDGENPVTESWTIRRVITKRHALAAIDALQTSLSGPAVPLSSEPEPPTSVAPAGEDYGAHVKPIYVDAWDGMAVPYDDHIVAVEAAHAAGMREALADFLTSIDEDDPVYLRGHSVGIRDGIQIGRVMAAHDVGWLGAWSMRADALNLTKWIVRLDYRRPPISLNSRMHWATKARFTREIRDLVALKARQQRIPGMDAAHVELHWVPADRRKRDSDNPFPTLKAAIDGIRDAGVVPDDDSEHVTSRVVIDPADPSDPHLYLLIERTS